MTQPALQPHFDAPTYLDWEAQQGQKHEYFDGEVFAMAGASDSHVQIAGNVYMALRQHLRGGPCSVFISDMKLRVERDNAFYYPDVMVSCEPRDAAHSHFKTAPTLLVEVLSPSTSAYDRGGKFASYRKIASLREYLLIDSERASVDLFRRDEGGLWVLHPQEGLDGQLQLASVALTLALAAVYEDVRLPAPPPGPGPDAETAPR